jgi:hypothetical protein
MATRDAKQGAGVESGLSKKEKIGDYVPRTSNNKHFRPHSPPTEKAPDGHKIK